MAGWRSQAGRWVGSTWGPGALLAETLIVLGPQGGVCVAAGSSGRMVLFSVPGVSRWAVWGSLWSGMRSRGAWEACERGVWSGAGVQAGLRGGEQMVGEQGRSSKTWT